MIKAITGQLGPIVQAYMARSKSENDVEALAEVSDNLCPHILGSYFARAKTMNVIHLRLGDVLAVGGSGADRDVNTKRFASRAVRRPPEPSIEVRAILDALGGKGSVRLSPNVTEHSAFVTSLHKSDSKATALSIQYLNEIRIGTGIRNILSSEDSNKDWCLLVVARLMVAGKGGFSKTASEVRILRGRPTIYDDATSTYFNAHATKDTAT
jgi:hypothetical protein